MEGVSSKRIFVPPVFSFPSLVNEESLFGVSKLLPKQLWEAKKVRASQRLHLEQLLIQQQLLLKP